MSRCNRTARCRCRNWSESAPSRSTLEAPRACWLGAVSSIASAGEREEGVVESSGWSRTDARRQNDDVWTGSRTAGAGRSTVLVHTGSHPRDEGSTCDRFLNPLRRLSFWSYVHEAYALPCEAGPAPSTGCPPRFGSVRTRSIRTPRRITISGLTATQRAASDSRRTPPVS